MGRAKSSGPPKSSGPRKPGSESRSGPESSSVELRACPHCRRRMPKEDMKRHLMQEHKHVSLDCQYCGKTFKMRHHLRQHILSIHLGERYFKCKLCDFNATQPSVLKTHERTIHQKLKLFVCAFCDDFSTNNVPSIKNHLVKKHGVKSDELKVATKKCRVSFARSKPKENEHDDKNKDQERKSESTETDAKEDSKLTEDEISDTQSESDDDDDDDSDYTTSFERRRRKGESKRSKKQRKRQKKTQKHRRRLKSCANEEGAVSQESNPDVPSTEDGTDLASEQEVISPISTPKSRSRSPKSAKKRRVSKENVQDSSFVSSPNNATVESDVIEKHDSSHQGGIGPPLALERTMEGQSETRWKEDTCASDKSIAFSETCSTTASTSTTLSPFVTNGSREGAEASRTQNNESIASSTEKITDVSSSSSALTTSFSDEPPRVPVLSLPRPNKQQKMSKKEDERKSLPKSKKFKSRSSKSHAELPLHKLLTYRCNRCTFHSNDCDLFLQHIKGTHLSVSST